MKYPVTVCGLTFELPREHKFGQDRKRQLQWYINAIGWDRDLIDRLSGRERVGYSGGSTIRVLVTEEEERSIQIAELLRRRDEERRNLKYTTEKLRIAEKRLSELGYVEMEQAGT